jgi:hypothetical protein
MKIVEVTTQDQWQWQLAYEINQRLDAGDTSVADGVDFDIFGFDILCYLLRLDKKTASVLSRHNLTKMSAILACKSTDLLWLPRLGRQAYEQIVNGLARLGKTLAPL